jgi:hypothetical protein
VNLDSLDDQRTKYEFESDLDKNGIIFNMLDSNIPVQVIVSEQQANGQPKDFLSRENVFCWTTNQPNSW